MSVEIHYGAPGWLEKMKASLKERAERRKAERAAHADTMVMHGAEQSPTFGTHHTMAYDDDDMDMNGTLPSVAFVGKGRTMPPQFLEHMRGEEHDEHEHQHNHEHEHEHMKKGMHHNKK